MSKGKDFIVGVMKGASRGFDVGLTIGIPLSFLSRDRIPSHSFIQGLFNDQSAFPAAREGSLFQKINLFAITGSVVVAGTIGALVGGIKALLGDDEKAAASSAPVNAISDSDSVIQPHAPAPAPSFSKIAEQPSHSRPSYASQHPPRNAEGHAPNIAEAKSQPAMAQGR